MPATYQLRAHASRRPVYARAVLLLARLLGLALVAIPPLLGAWLASSLTAMAGGPGWLAACAGVLLFPLLPLAWEVGWLRRRAERERARGQPLKKPWLAPYARFLLRTTVISLVFLGFLLAWFPERSFLALATRGDWFLAPEGPGAPPSSTRRALLGAARGLEWLYALSRDDPFRELHDRTPLPSAKPKPAPGLADARRPGGEPHEPAPVVESVDGGVGDEPPPPPPPRTQTLCATLEDGRKVCIEAPVREEPPEAADAGVPAPGPKPGGDGRGPPAEPRVARNDASWPQPAALHPVVVAMTSSDEGSVESVAAYLKARTRPGADRVRALHDWVADRIAYDGEAFRDRQFPPQDAETVHRTRKAVCAGYARLLTRLGQLADERIVYLVGEAKALGGVWGHAWNAAQLDGGWVLMDATWSAGGLDPSFRFQKDFSTDFLFAPPAFFAETHLPDEPDWQLLEPPLDRVAFLRSHGRTPAFFGSGIEIVSPPANADVGFPFDVVVRNPAGRFVVASVCPKGADCAVCEGAGPGAERHSCRAPWRGEVQVRVAFGDGPQALLPGASFPVRRP